MSRFTIYSSKGMPLKKMGLINRRTSVTLIISFALLNFVNILLGLSGLSPNFFLAGLSLWGLLFLFLLFYNFYIKRSLNSLGEIEISSAGILKNIGGFVEFFEFSKIREINIKEHLRSFLWFGVTKTVLITIDCEGVDKEQFVLGNYSSDKPVVEFPDLIKKVSLVTKKRLKIT